MITKAESKEYWLVFLSAFAGFVLSDVMSIFTENMKPAQRILWDFVAFLLTASLIGIVIFGSKKKEVQKHGATRTNRKL